MALCVGAAVLVGAVVVGVAFGPRRLPDTQPIAPRAAADDTVAGLRVRVLAGEPCLLRYDRAVTRAERPQTIRLFITGSCTLHRDLAGAVRVQRVRGDDVFLVESSVHNPNQPRDCDTRVQAVIVGRGDSAGDGGRTLELRARVSEGVSRVASCPPFQWDDAMFRGLSERPSR